MQAADRSADLAAVRKGIVAANRGDLDAVPEGFDDPEVELHIAPGLGNAGTYRGLDGYRRGFGGCVEAFDDFRVDELELEAIGDRHVVVDARQSVRCQGSGIEVEMRLGYMFELRGGRAVRFHILHNREEARARAEAGERASR